MTCDYMFTRSNHNYIPSVDAMAYARSLVCNIPWLPITHFECNSAAAATNATVTNPEILLSVMGNWAYVHICIMIVLKEAGLIATNYKLQLPSSWYNLFLSKLRQ